MKHQSLTAALIVLCCLSFTSAQSQSPEMTKLAWLAGCWKSDGKVQTEEQWTKPAGGSMLGAGRTIKEGRTESYEFLQIREQADGIFYIAQANGGKGTSFKLVKLNDSAAIFENAQHDFPQRIAYQRLIDGSLLAAIEGDENGKAKRIEFPMQRVRCD